MGDVRLWTGTSFVWLLSCGAPAPQAEAPPLPPPPPPADPAFPTGFATWTTAPLVTDPETGGRRQLFRSEAPGKSGAHPVGTVLVKAHLAPGDATLFTALDVRRRVAQGGLDGWAYLQFDPATRKRRPIDAETCHLCHAAAPADGTYTAFSK